MHHTRPSIPLSCLYFGFFCVLSLAVGSALMSISAIIVAINARLLKMK